jgi:hypothetical protein
MDEDDMVDRLTPMFLGDRTAAHNAVQQVNAVSAGEAEAIVLSWTPGAELLELVRRGPDG